VSTPTTVAGRYRLDRRLGAGGMSTVFLALDTVLERNVAVKLLAEHLAEDEAFVARFRREALAAARLQHPNVVQVFDSGADEGSGRHFIVMEYVDGPSCADLIRGQKQLEIERAVRYLRDACHGLDYAHRAGVVHRDVKPGNLLVSEDTDSVKLADFGIAKAAEQTRITQVGSVLGTAAYLSPEQARGDEVGPASDLYSLGVCAYQLLSGRLPHEYASITELALKQQSDRVEPIAGLRPEVPRALDQVVQICLEPDPAARYGSALELAEALEAGLRDDYTEATRLLAAGPTQAPSADEEATQALPRTAATGRAREPAARVPAQPRERRPERKRRRRPLASLAAILAVLLAGAAVALAVIAASDGGVERAVKDNVHDQVDYLKQLIRDHSEQR
jgi:eukaryotic-like serine/threonine-protein kinase